MNSNLKRFALLMALMWLSSSVLLLAGPHTMLLENSDSNQTIDGPSPVMEVSETDLDRVNWSANHAPNPGFELWQNPHQLEDYGGSYDRTTEHYGWYASSPWPVNEGTRSLGMQARAIDYDHPSEMRVRPAAQSSWLNPANLSLKFDYYIDANPNPTTDFDHFVVHLELRDPSARNMWYYLSGGETNINGSNVYFTLDSPVDTWNTFDRNITEDFFDFYGHYPTEFRVISYYIVSKTNDYIRVFLDDVNLVNGTNVKIGGPVAHGNFEIGGTGTYWTWTNRDPADISQSTLRRNGDWSLNMTALSNGNRSYCQVAKRYDIRLTELNPDSLSFWWRIEDLQESSDETYAYLEVECRNETLESFHVWYWLTYGGGESAPIDYDGYQMIDVDGFNLTGSWQFFNRSIFEDITAVNQTQELVVENVELHVYVGQGGRLSVLLDDLSFVSAALNDMGYEDQLDIGTPVRAWNTDYENPSFLVTGQAYAGEKAANLTIADGDSYQESQRVGSMQLTEETEIFLDVNWRLEDFSRLDGEFAGVEVYLDDDLSFAYIFANGSDPAGANGFDEYIILSDANTEGSWFNMQRCLSKDYEALFGSAPNTSIAYLYLVAESETSGRIEILFDDFYLYTDPAPDVHSVVHSPSSPEADAAVEVTAVAIDPSMDTVSLYYRVNEGSWTNLEMSVVTDDSYDASIPGQSEDSVVEYYITAEDTFGKTTTALNGSDYFSYIVMAAASTTTTTTTTATTTPTPPPADMTPLIIGAIVVVIAIVVLVYIFIIRPKQETT